MNKNIRLDINGLRAIAVLFVVIYHFVPNLLPGGFLGVDVFLVISGYVITGSIMKRSAAGTFTYVSFIKDRLARLFPALFVLICILLLIGNLLLPIAESKELYSQSIYSLTNVSNISFWQSSGYFDSSAYQKILLHTWSLSLEWQFYLIYPLFILMFANPNKSLIFVIGILFASFVSFGLSVYFSGKAPSANFYLLPTRAWEIGFGCFLYFVKLQKKYQPLCFITGLSLITFSVLSTTSATPWPSWPTLLPTIGAALVIMGNSNHYILTNKIFQWIGTRSYSIYLYHWPIFYFSVFFEFNYNFYGVIISILLSFLLASFSFSLIEQPLIDFFRRKSKPNFKFINVSILYLFLLVLSSNLRLVSPLSDKYSISSLDSFSNLDRCLSTGKSGELKKCSFGNLEGPLKAIVVGDSHATSIMTIVSQLAQNAGGHAIMLAKGSCPTVADVKYREHITTNIDVCSSFNENVFDFLNKIPSNIPVIIHNRSSVYIKGDNYKYAKNKDFNQSMYIDQNSIHDVSKNLSEYLTSAYDTVCNLSKTNNVFLLLPIPEMPLNVPLTLARRNLLSKEAIENIKISMGEYENRHKEIINIYNKAVKNCGLKILDPRAVLCDDSLCFGMKDEQVLYYDNNHLSESSGKILAPIFTKIL